MCQGQHTEACRAKMRESSKGRHYSPVTEIQAGQHLSMRTEFKIGQPSPRRKPDGHTFVDKNTGYRMIKSSRSKNGWAREHTVIAERVLGRRLKPGEEVHHVNGNKLDNRNCNLLICSTSYHRELERKMAYLYQQEHFGGS